MMQVEAVLFRKNVGPSNSRLVRVILVVFVSHALLTWRAKENVSLLSEVAIRCRRPISLADFAA